MPYHGDWPQVQAYRGPLGAGQQGVEFFTDIAPDIGDHPDSVSWSGPPWRADVRVEGEFAKITCVVVKVVYSEVGS